MRVRVKLGLGIIISGIKLGKSLDTTKSIDFLIFLCLTQTMLALPHATAEVERVFSAVSLLKTNLRNKLSTSMLESLLIVRNGLGEITPAMIDGVNASMYDHKQEH